MIYLTLGPVCPSALGSFAPFALGERLLRRALAGGRRSFRRGGRGRRLRPSSAAQVPSAPSGACAVLASNLQVKGLATGQPPTPAFFRMLVESGRRVAEFCAKSVRVHGIKFLENKCLVLKCEGIKGVLSKYVKLLVWTTLKVFLKDQQLFKYIDMKLSDNEENIF